MKKVVSILLVLTYLLVGFGVFANGQQEKSGEKKIFIGVAAANFDDKWLTYMHDGFKMGAEEYGVKITMTDGRNDPGLQPDQVSTLVTQGVDAIVICPVDASNIGPIINECEEAGIPLISVNRKPDEPYYSKLATYVGSDNWLAGTLEAEAIADLLGGEGKVAIMRGFEGPPATHDRTDSAKEVFDKYPGIEVVLEDCANYSRADGITLMENWIQSGVHFDAVVSNNDEMAIGAILALEQLDMLDEVFISGVDATPDALQFIAEGKLDVSVFQDAYGQGFGGIKAAVDAVNGKELPDYIDVPYELVTTENYQDYMDRYKSE